MELKRQAVRDVSGGDGVSGHRTDRYWGSVLSVCSTGFVPSVNALSPYVLLVHRSTHRSSNVMSYGTLWGKKRRLWVWIALTDSGAMPIDFELGSRQARTGRRLWERIKSVRCTQ